MPRDLEKEKTDLFAKVTSLYGLKRNDPSEKIKKGLQERFTAISALGDATKVEDFLDLTKDIFDERKLLVTQRKNVMRQLKEIDDADIKPAAVDIRKYDAQDIIPENRQEISWIKNREDPVTRVQKAGMLYRQDVVHAGYEVQDGIDLNFERLNSLMEKGIDVDEETKKELGSKRTKHRSLNYTGNIAADCFQKVGKKLGAGLVTESKASDTTYNADYSARKQRMLDDLLSKMDINHSRYASILSKISGKLESEDCDLSDLAAYNKIKELLAAQILKEEEEHKKQWDNFNTSLGKDHEKMLEDMQKNVDESDMMWKYRLLSMCLIFTPLGAFSVAGHVFNYLDPVAKFVGPLFDGNVSFSQALGDMVTSDQLGFIGDAMEGMRIDDAITGILDNTPLVNTMCDTIDCLMDSEVGRSIFGHVIPFLESPMTLLLVAGAVAKARAPYEIDHFVGKEKIIANHDQKLKDRFDNFQSDVMKRWEGDVASNVIALAEVKKQGNYNLKMCEFFLDNVENPQMAAIFDRVYRDAKFKIGNDEKTLQELYYAGKFVDRDGNQSVKTMLQYLNGSEVGKDDYKNFTEKSCPRFLLLASLDQDITNHGTVSKNHFNLLTKYSDKEAEIESEKDQDKKKKLTQEETSKARTKFDQQLNFNIDREVLEEKLRLRSEIPSYTIHDPRYATLCGDVTRGLGG